MNIKFPPLINVDGDLTGVSTFGRETVVLEIALKNKIATITLTRHEAVMLLNNLRAAGVEEPEIAQSTGPAIPKISIPRKW